MPANLTMLTRAVLRDSPASVRALARAAGVPYATLARILRGELGASPAVVQALGKVLRRWGRRYLRAADRLRGVTEEGRGPRSTRAARERRAS